MYSITARERKKGSGVKKSIACHESSKDVRKANLQRWCIWVHGYNNSEAAAQSKWDELQEKFLSVPGGETKHVVRYYWPGDQFKAKFPSAAAYPLQIKVAQQCAELLATFIENYVKHRKKPLSICIVAHSLGCLLTLEAIQKLRDVENLRIEQVVLMAAAVPVGFCDLSLPDGYLAPAGKDTKEKILYSQDDRVLKRYFKLGQWAARAMPKWGRRAVGWSGGPGTGPGERWTHSKCLDGHDHGDYWSEVDSIAAFSELVSPERTITRHDLQRVTIKKSSLLKNTVPHRSSQKKMRIAHLSLP